MSKCKDCNAEMINGNLYGEPRFIDMDHDIDKFYVDVETGNTKSFLGLKIKEKNRAQLSVKICPNCGKVEMYINPDDIKK